MHTQAAIIGLRSEVIAAPLYWYEPRPLTAHDLHRLGIYPRLAVRGGCAYQARLVKKRRRGFVGQGRLHSVGRNLPRRPVDVLVGSKLTRAFHS